MREARAVRARGPWAAALTLTVALATGGCSTSGREMPAPTTTTPTAAKVITTATTR